MRYCKTITKSTMKYCKHCRKPMPDKRGSALYCSSGCKSLAYRKRKGIEAPAFLNREKTGHQRTRASALTPEEERMVRNLEMEIKSYTEPLESAEKKFEYAHALKVKYELGLYLPEKWRKDPKPCDYPPTLPREPQEGDKQDYDRYQHYLEKYNKFKPLYDEWEKEPYKLTARKEIYVPFQKAEEDLLKINRHIIERKNEIEKIIGVAVERKNSRSKIVTGKDLARMVFNTLDFDGKWFELIGEPSKCFYGLIWGDAKAGKSYFSVEFAQYLTKFGKTLYIAVEEGYGSTLQRKVVDMKAWDIELKATRSFTELESFISNHSFVFIDSVTILSITPEQIEGLRIAHPETSFIVLLQSVKAGANFKGDQSWKHNVDFVIEIQKSGENDGTAICSGRFGNNSLKYTYESVKNTSQSV